MGRSADIAGLKLIHETPDPILICGIPGRLQGVLNLHNDSGSKMTLKSMPLQAPKLRGLARQPINEVALSARLYPNQQGSVAFQFPIDPTTPPGTYEASLKIGGRTQAVQIRVNEHIELRVLPDTLTLYTDGERRFEREFVVSNVGNVAVPVGDKCVAPLRSPQGLGQQLQWGLKDVCKKAEDESPDSAQLLKQVLCALAAQQAGLVTMRRENVTLEPGETRVIKGVIELPADMQLFQHYVTDVEMFSARVRLHVYTRMLKQDSKVG